MTDIKYQAISKTLEDNIKNNVYRDKLPPVRTLSAEFAVSTRTMNKALKQLVTKGLIIPRGPRGIIINRKDVIRPKTNIVAIFCNTEHPDLNDDPMLKELRIKIESDGYKPLFMNVPDPNDLDDVNFWSSNWVDGYIFAYSSIRKKLAYKLHNKSVPFVVANRLPAECGAHWVEFNLKKTLQLLVQAFIEAGRNKIMFAFSRMNLPSYIDYVKQVWNEISKENPQKCLEYLPYFAGHDDEKSNRKCAKLFVELQADALIIIGLSPLLIEAELAVTGRKINKDYSLVYRSQKVEAPISKFPYVLAPYKALADETWNLFKKVVENPELEAQNILVNEDIHINKITRRNMFSAKLGVNSTTYTVAEV